MAAGEVKEKTVYINGLAYPVPGLVTRVELGAFERKITIGDATKDSDDFISSWIISDLSGGIGVERFTSSDTSRYGTFGVIDGRTPGQITIPPLAVATRPTAFDSHVLYPLGDVPGTNEEFYVVVNEGAGVVRLYAWNESSDAWRAATDDIDFVPVAKPVVYRGTAANNHMYIPQGANGYAYVRTDGLGTVASTLSATPTVLAFAVWDNRLWSIDASGVIRYSFDGVTWTALTDPFTGGNVTLDSAKTPRHLIPFYDTTSAPRLYIISDKGVDMLDLDTPKIETTHIRFAPHPYAGRAAAVWREGEDVWIGTGGNHAIRYTPAGVVIGLQGPGADRDGLLPTASGHIVDFCPTPFGLYAMLRSNIDQGLLFYYDGVGWHRFDGGLDLTPTWVVMSTASSAFRVWWSGSSYAVTSELESVPMTPIGKLGVATFKFGTTGYFVSPRFDAGMQAFDKLAVRVAVIAENATATEKIEVWYRKDLPGGTFTLLGTATADGKSVFQFGTQAGGIYPGMPFNWIEFYVVLYRDALTPTTAPIMASLALHFLKIRQNTQSFSFAVTPPDDYKGRGMSVIRGELEALMEATTTFSFKHGRDTFRAWLAGMETVEGTGNNGNVESINLTLLVIPS